jgi:hypothetical protein
LPSPLALALLSGGPGALAVRGGAKGAPSAGASSAGAHPDSLEVIGMRSGKTYPRTTPGGKAPAASASSTAGQQGTGTGA